MPYFEDLPKEDLIFIIEDQKEEITALKEEIEYLQNQLYNLERENYR